MMNRLLSIRSVLSLALLWLATSALVLSLQVSIKGLLEAPFLPLAIFGMVIAYMLGLSNWTMLRSWCLIIFFSPFLIILEASHSWNALWQIVSHFPRLLFQVLLALLTKQSLDLSFFQIQLAEIFYNIENLLRVASAGNKNESLTMIELFWNIPLYAVCAWAGWWSSRKNLILIALLPSLTLQTFLLNYAQKHNALSLQIGVFAFILLIGLHQKWNPPKNENKIPNKIRLQTYGMVFILASLLTSIAGWVPIIPAQEKETENDKTQPATSNSTTIVKNSAPSTSSGLPESHLLNAPPKNLTNVIFLANTGEAPLDKFDGVENKFESTTAQRYYWRWLTYDMYDGATWSSSSSINTFYTADQVLFEFNEENYRVVHQTIMKASSEDDHVYWTGHLLSANQPIKSTWRTWPAQEDPLLHMDMLGALTQKQQYSADSLLPEFTETQLRNTAQIYPPEILQNYLDLPRTISQRVRDLAVTLTFQHQNPYDKAKAIEAYLRTYPYTLDVPIFPKDKEVSDYFLFELKTGFCDYYSTSMIVLARTVGLPARLVIGYASNEYDPRSAQYIVRETHAHSWVEIYFQDIGWVEFEPTASQPLIERLSEDLNLPVPSITPSNSRAGAMYQKQGFFVKKSPALLVFLLILIAIVFCLRYLYKQGFWFSYNNIGSIYKYIFYHGKKIYFNAPPNATPSFFMTKLRRTFKVNNRFILPGAGELTQLTSLYLKETYSAHPITKDELSIAIKIWRKLFWRLLYLRIIYRLVYATST